MLPGFSYWRNNPDEVKEGGRVTSGPVSKLLIGDLHSHHLTKRGVIAFQLQAAALIRAAWGGGGGEVAYMSWPNKNQDHAQNNTVQYMIIMFLSPLFWLKNNFVSNSSHQIVVYPFSIKVI